MGQEEVHRTDDLSLYPVDPDHVLQADFGLTGTDQEMGRATGPEHRSEHDGTEEQDDAGNGTEGNIPCPEANR
jgi:hypothetical protein